MDLISYLKKEIIAKAYRHGLILTPEALDYLLHYVHDVDRVLRELSRRGITTVRLEDLVESPREEPSKVQESEPPEPEPQLPEPASPCTNRIRVRLYVDPGEIYPSSWEREQERILRERIEELSSVLISKGRVSFVSYDRAKRNEEMRYILGLVLKVERSASGRTILYVENGEESDVVISVGEKSLERKLSMVDEDMVLALGVTSREGRLFLRDLVFPGTTGHVPSRENCSYRLLVIPDAHRFDLQELLKTPSDGVLLLSNVVNVYSTPDPRKTYRELDEVLSSLDKDVFVVPGPLDAVRVLPPHPPVDEDLMPNSSASDHVYLLGSPAAVKINSTTLLFYDGEYHRRRGKPLDVSVLSRLVQPPIGSFPYEASRDFSLLKKLPDLFLSPVGGSPRELGGVQIIPLTEPYVVELSSRKVIALEEGRG
ncbi:MAG: hypothetical protein GXO00_02855 [Candidatus Diapherotrites archaeon]|nr:hypothetical protein [Candidatus Diapherotrites archaeon]